MNRFDEIYLGTPPWEIGRAQETFVRLASEGTITGRVLDAGCGSGENALHIAERGYEVTGIDGAAAAIEKARSKARQRGLATRATFVHGDALELGALGQAFDTAIDCGLFHVFSDEERPRYARSLATALRPGGRLLLLCFSEAEPGDWGPRRVTRDEIRAAFGDRFRVEAIEPSRFIANIDSGFARAWLARLVCAAATPGAAKP